MPLQKTIFLSYKLSEVPEPVERPASVHVDEETNRFRFEPFEVIDQQVLEFEVNSAILNEMLISPQNNVDKTEYDYLQALAKEKSSSLEIAQSLKILEEERSLLAHKKVVIQDTIESLEPNYDIEALYEKYNNEFVPYAKYRNYLALEKLIQSRTSGDYTIQDMLSEFDKSTFVQTESKRFFSVLYKNNVKYPIESLIPMDLNEVLTTEEFNKVVMLSRNFDYVGHV